MTLVKPQECGRVGLAMRFSGSHRRHLPCLSVRVDAGVQQVVRRLVRMPYCIVGHSLALATCLGRYANNKGNGRTVVQFYNHLVIVCQELLIVNHPR